MSERHFLVVGAGLGGALMACFLARAGHRVTVVERRSDPRARGFIGGRSINLALSTRGIAALREVELADGVLADVVPMRGRMMHAVDGDLTFQPYSKDAGDAINSVSRGGLNLALLEAADAYDTVTLRFDAPCVTVDPDAPSVTVRDGDGETELGADAIIGADGAFSAVRGVMQRLDRFDYRQDWLQHGYKELTIPPTDAGAFAMEPNALHIWPRGGFMMIALPNLDRSFTCTCFWPFAGPTGFDAIASDEDVRPFFDRWFPDAVPLMPTLVEDFRRNPTSSLVTVRCRPWRVGGTTVLLGDAAHAIVPFYGQGMNCAFEDCSALAACLAARGDDLDAAFADYETRRKENADAIADLALENFIEMRDKVGSSVFLAKKRMEKTLHRLFPSTFVPLYNLVSFSTVPYAEARRRVRRRHARLLGLAAAVAVAVVVVIGVMLAA
ncbi:MAG: FAD-dependent oxidoreductase [Planctomycetota bacterium]|jgi:kynurenine 3-monooxygenase